MINFYAFAVTLHLLRNQGAHHHTRAVAAEIVTVIVITKAVVVAAAASVLVNTPVTLLNHLTKSTGK